MCSVGNWKVNTKLNRKLIGHYRVEINNSLLSMLSSKCNYKMRQDTQNRKKCTRKLLPGFGAGDDKDEERFSAVWKLFPLKKQGKERDVNHIIIKRCEK